MIKAYDSLASNVAVPAIISEFIESNGTPTEVVFPAKEVGANPLITDLKIPDGCILIILSRGQYVSENKFNEAFLPTFMFS